MEIHHVIISNTCYTSAILRWLNIVLQNRLIVDTGKVYRQNI